MSIKHPAPLNSAQIWKIVTKNNEMEMPSAELHSSGIFPSSCITPGSPSNTEYEVSDELLWPVLYSWGDNKDGAWIMYGGKAYTCKKPTFLRFYRVSFPFFFFFTFYPRMTAIYSIHIYNTCLIKYQIVHGPSSALKNCLYVI